VSGEKLRGGFSNAAAGSRDYYDLSSMFDVTILLFPFSENSSVSDSHSRSSWNTDVPADVWLGWNSRYLVVISDYMRIGPRRAVLGFNVVGCRLMKEGFTLPAKLTKKFRLQVLNFQGCAIPSRRHTHNAAEDFREMALVGETATHGSLKHRNAGLVKQLPGMLNPPP